MNKEDISMLEMDTFNKLSLPPAAECLYTSCYCEENVWKLCEYVKNNQKDLLPLCYVVFISNKNESVPLWNQKSGTDNEKLAIWDYHVIFIYNPPNNSETLVYDLDSVLQFPTGLQLYSTLTFRSESILRSIYYRSFRVIPSDEFLKTFASDRSRMKKPDGSWIKPPPPFPCLKTHDSTNNLDDFITMDQSRGIGVVMNLQQFLNRFL